MGGRQVGGTPGWGDAMLQGVTVSQAGKDNYSTACRMLSSLCLVVSSLLGRAMKTLHDTMGRPRAEDRRQTSPAAMSSLRQVVVNS